LPLIRAPSRLSFAEVADGATSSKTEGGRSPDSRCPIVVYGLGDLLARRNHEQRTALANLKRDGRGSPGCRSERLPNLATAPPAGSSLGRLVWLRPGVGAFYAHHDPSAGSFHLGTNTVRRENGWGVKVLWVLQPTMIEPVTLSGQEVGTGSPITFDASGLNPTRSDTMRLDPSNPGTPSHRKGWSEYPSSLSFPEAGCYIIKASWADGSWQRGLGFGK
jgi:hypothetical protein